MRKTEAVNLWRRDILTVFNAEEREDRGMLSESWSAFIHYLREDGKITESQYHEWLPPAECRPKKF